MINGATLQDAYHYALAIAEDDRSSFAPRNNTVIETLRFKADMIENYLNKLKEMDCEANEPKNEASLKVWGIYQAGCMESLAELHGIDPMTGNKLVDEDCTRCIEIGRSLPHPAEPGQTLCRRCARDAKEQ